MNFSTLMILIVIHCLVSGFLLRYSEMHPDPIHPPSKKEKVISNIICCLPVINIFVLWLGIGAYFINKAATGVIDKAPDLAADIFLKKD